MGSKEAKAFASPSPSSAAPAFFRPSWVSVMCFFSAAIFTTVSSTRVKQGRREIAIIIITAIIKIKKQLDVGKKKKTREWGREQAKFKIVIG